MDNNRRIRRFHPVFMMVDRIALSTIVATTFSSDYCVYAMLAWTTLFTVYIAVANPYELKRDYGRSLYTQGSILLI